MSDSTQFDELTPLHPHVVPRTGVSVSARVAVRRAARRGHVTTEFWLAAAAIAGPIALALADVDRRRLRDVAIGGGIAAAGYALGRSYVKGALIRARGRADA